MDMTQTEIDELRRLASVSREPRHGIGCIASDCALASAARNALPRLLAALEEARAERDKLQDESNAVASAFERYAPLTDSLETTAHSLVNAAHERDDADEVLAKATAFIHREGYVQCDNPSCNCDSWHARDGWYKRFMEIVEVAGDNAGTTVLASVTKAIEDRDAAESLAWDALGRPDGTHNTTNVQRLCEAHGALKATLAKHAESERAWCELATARGAKLAALVEAMEHIKDIMGGHDGCQGWDSPEDVWGIADKALAAAKVQP